MPCDHLQPQDLMQKAEEWLRERGIGEERWPGTRVLHGENTPNGMWASVVMELERRGDEWVVTRLDRNRERLAEEECGLQVVVHASS
jgi:hypothetical protein